jgi:hypothetical protein
MLDAQDMALIGTPGRRPLGPRERGRNALSRCSRSASIVFFGACAPRGAAARRRCWA